MGQKSTKENKNIYFASREECGLTREAAAELMGTISQSRIEKIEYDKSLPHPDEVLEMAKCYKKPSLCNYYCSHECRIGQEYVPAVEEKSLSQITLEMLTALSDITQNKDRLISIAADEEISEEELPDFLEIKKELAKMALVIDSLNLWVDKTIASGKIREEAFDA